MTDIYGGIEAGGTKFVCAAGKDPGLILDETRFPTTTPEETVSRAMAFFKSLDKKNKLVAVGIASFGPVDPDPESPGFGRIVRTPKPGWSSTDLAGAVKRALNLPVGFDTDVNGAALAEHRWGAARGFDTFIYMTVGTGIGGGGMVEGRLMHGLTHPEMGHIRLPRDVVSDTAKGICPFHGDCLEGLAAGPALEARWGKPAELLPPDHPAWEFQARYLGMALANFICTLSPQRIILGGGVMNQQWLFPKIRGHVLDLLNGYIQSPRILEQIDTFIVPPELGDRAGVLGAIELARRANNSHFGTKGTAPGRMRDD